MREEGPKKSGRGRTVPIVAAVLFCAILLGTLVAISTGQATETGLHLAGFKLEREPVLVVTNQKGKKLASIVIPDGRFSHVFVHSFHLTPVEELMELDPKGGFRLYELRYQSCGVGMPTETEEGFRLENGIFILSMQRLFKKIPVMVSILPGHGLMVGGTFYPFDEWAPPEDTLILLAKTRIVIRKLQLD